MSRLAAQGAEHWLGILKANLPKGPAWSVPVGSRFEQLLLAMADEFARADERLVRLVEEADPRTTVELIGEWERNFGLPDACAPLSTVLDDRQIAVAQRMVTVGGQSRAYFEELAARIGYTIRIVEYRAAHIGDRIGTYLFGDDSRFVWGVRVLERGPTELNLECLINRHKPAHTSVVFIYEETA